LRHRDISDCSTQPHPAPPGIAAQQSENFQKFYRAVVSPTHIRVTAGGRIVPNTRTNPPPQFDWSNDKFHLEPRNAIVVAGFEINGGVKPHWAPDTTPSMMMQSPLLNPEVPNPNGSLAPGALHPRSLLLSHTQPNISATKITAIEKPAASQMKSENANGLLQPNALPQPIKISPPTQFDQTKPFMFNGHVVYPVPPGFQPPPSGITMLGNPNFMPPSPIQPQTGFVSPQFQLSLGAMPSPMLFPGGPQFPMMMSSPVMAAENMFQMPPLLPIPSIDLRKEFLNSQIQILQLQVRQLEHQIVNAKNDIEVSFMQNQRGFLLAQIGTIESSLQAQATQEDNLANWTRADEVLRVSAINGKEQNLRSTRLSSAISDSSRYPQSSLSESNSNSIVGKAKQAHLTQNIGATRSEPAIKSRLSMAAAMAPPFKPRSQIIAMKTPVKNQSQAKPHIQSPEGLASIDNEALHEIEARLLASSSADWGLGNNSLTTLQGHKNLSRAHSIHEVPTKTQNICDPPAFNRSSTYHGQASNSSTHTLAMPSQAVPYLIGTLPQGVTANLAKPDDFIYARELTHDELRARYLYWGKAPRSVQSGLPKFDGKDFYPPSPVKNLPQLTPLPLDSGATRTQGSEEPGLLDFEKLFTEPGVPGYKTPPFTRTSLNEHTLAQATQKSLGSGAPSFGELCPQVSSLDLAMTSVSEQSNQAAHPPCTPHHVSELPGHVTNDDFSNLFTERGVPGYKSPPPLCQQTTQRDVHDKPKDDKLLVTPSNSKGAKDEQDGLNAQGSWGQVGESVLTRGSSTPESLESTSTVEIRLSSQNQMPSPNSVHERGFAERVENFRRYVSILRR
jgi:hypothetical protein